MIYVTYSVLSYLKILLRQIRRKRHGIFLENFELEFFWRNYLSVVNDKSMHSVYNVTS